MSTLLAVAEIMFVGASVGAVALERWLDPRRRARRSLKGMPECLIRELTDGERARVKGRVAAMQELQPSPINQRPCIGFRVVVERAVRGDPSNGFAQILARESCQPFSVTDETATAIVEGPFMIGLDFDDSSWSDLPPSVFKLLDESGISPIPTVLRFREAFLLPGDEITVQGAISVGIHPAGEPGGFREPPTVRRIVGTDRAPVVVCDVSEDAGGA